MSEMKKLLTSKQSKVRARNAMLQLESQCSEIPVGPPHLTPMDYFLWGYIMRILMI